MEEKLNSIRLNSTERPEATNSKIQITLGSVMKVPGGKIEEAAEDQRFDPIREVHDEKNPGRVSPLDELSVSAEPIGVLLTEYFSSAGAAEAQSSNNVQHDTGAPEEETPNIRRRRTKRDATSQLIALNVMKKEPEVSERFSFQGDSSTMESASLASLTKTRQKSKTHRTNCKKAKPAQISRLRDDPTHVEPFNSGFRVEFLDIRTRDPKNKATLNSSAESETYQRLQEKKKTLRCSFCSRCFRHISAFTRHKRIHTGEKPYRCFDCTKRFSRRSQLNLHSKVHKKSPTVRCPCCGGTFRSKAELILHFRVHLNKAESSRTEPEENGPVHSDSSHGNAFRCSVCSKEFLKKSTLKMHQQRHDRKLLSSRSKFSRDSGFHKPTFDLRDPSEIDGFMVSQSDEVKIVTPVFFKCPICKRLHQRWCHYVLHLRSHTSGRSWRCDACRQQYDGLPEPRGHCSVCCRHSGEEAACRGSLSDIWKEAEAPRTNDDEDVQSEVEKDDGTSKFSQVLPSIEAVPSLMNDFDLDAPLSSFFPSFVQLAGRRSMFPRLTGRFLCGRCGKMFPHWNKLWLHQRLHQRGSKMFCCSLCELEFRFLGSYVDHLQKHAAQMPQACPPCPDTFTEETNLNTHTSSIHKRPDCPKCNTCGKRFSTLRNLKKHQLLHKGRKSHVCLPCSRSFFCSASLTAHLQTHRKRLSVPRPARVEEPFLFPYHCRRCSAQFSSSDLLQAHQVCHFVTGKTPESSPERVVSQTPNIQRIPSESSQWERRLPVSSKKHLFRYPHPDRLYVVSSEPPVLVSDTEDETDRNSTQLEVLVKSLIPERRLNLSDSSDSESEDRERSPRKNDVWKCALCTETFSNITTLHEHYRGHARSM